MSTTETQQLEIFKAQLGIPVPLAYGRHVARGNLLIQYEYTDGTYGAKTRIAFIGLGEGEWDGIDRLWVNRKRVVPTDTTFVHFHPGIDGVLGHGLTPDSTGGDQLVDTFWSSLPANMQAITFDRIAYLALKIPPDPGAPGPDIDVIGHYRTMKVRVFDAAGAVTAYQFSTNPSWCILDFIIRRFLNREATINTALTANEKARINFQSFIDAAADCDVVCPDGTKRFELNLAWPRQASAQAMLEQMLGNCRGYLVDASGQLSLSIDKPRATTFTLTHDHIPPQAIRFSKPLRGQANRFKGNFRDLSVAKMATISAITRAAGVTTVTYSAAHGFRKDDYIDHVAVTDATFNTLDNKLTAIPGPTQVQHAQAGGNATSSGGYSGMSEQRFRDASWSCQHGQHALAIGQRGVGLAAIPKWTPLELDFGNNIYAQVQRVLKYLKTRYLGDDSSPYKAPWSGVLRAHYNAVDAADRILAAQLPGDTIALDRSVSEEFQGDYEIINRKVIRGARGSGQPKILELELLQYLASAFIDNPDSSPGIASPVPRAGLVLSGGPANGSYRPLSDPLTATDAGATATINTASVPVRFTGISPDPVYGAGAIAGLSFATQYFIYADDPDRQGGAVAYAATTTKENALTQSGWIFMGSIITPNDGGSDTVGNGDGGAGAQVGRLFTALPGTYAIVGAWNNPANGVDPDTLSYADITTGATGAEFKAYDFPPLFGGFGTLLLKIKNQFVTLSSGRTGTVEYSLDGGSSWTIKRTVAAADGAPVTDQVNLSVLQNPQLVQGKVVVPQSQDTPVNNAGTVADNNAVGTVAWGTPTNAQGAPNATYASAASSVDSAVSHYLKATGFGFAVPGGATILGIQLDLYTSISFSGLGSTDNLVDDSTIKLLKAGVVVGSNKANAIDWGAGVRSYGGPADLWGTTWTVADVNSATFGAVVSVIYGIVGGSVTPKVDAFAITVTYDSGAGSTQTKVFYFRQEAQQ